MNIRPIDANALRKRVKEWMQEFSQEFSTEYIYQRRDLEDLLDYIDDAPTIKKKAHWVFGVTHGHCWMKCSDCLKAQQGQTATFSYCPNCGAEMSEDATYE